MTRPSFSCRRCSLPVFSMAAARLVIVNFMEDAASTRRKRPMVRARRAARIGGRKALLAALALRIVADDQVALHYVHLFPMIVDERLRGEGARLYAQQARAAAAL